MNVAGWSKIIISELPVEFEIGVNDDEHGRTQRVLISLEATIGAAIPFTKDRIEETVPYDTIVQSINQLACQGHIGLVEILAERIAAIALGDARVLDVEITIEKTGVYPGGGRVGTRIYRRRDV